MAAAAAAVVADCEGPRAVAGAGALYVEVEMTTARSAGLGARVVEQKRTG